MGTRSYRTTSNGPSPVEERRRTLPQGDGQWPGSHTVYRRLWLAAKNLAECRTKSPWNTYLSDDHIHTMAVMGCGHEETQKAWAARCIENGWVEI